VTLAELFRQKRPVLLGIDISASHVKLLELSEHEQRFRVEAFAVETLPPNSVVEKTITDVETVGETIRRAVRRSGTKIRDAAVSVPVSSVISKVIQMPAALSEDELSTQIELEADQYIPYPLEEVALDFEVLGHNDANPDLVDILLVACRSENVDARVAALELGGLVPRVVDVESFALENAFMLISSQLPNSGFEHTIGVVDIGMNITTLFVLDDQQMIYTRETVFGEQQLIDEIQRRYGLDFEEAKLARENDDLPDSYVPEVLEPFKEAVAQQISRSLQFFYSSSRYSQLDHLVLSGEATHIEGLEETVSKYLDLPTSIANPFTSMTLAPKVSAPALAADAANLLVECGLALRSFD